VQFPLRIKEKNDGYEIVVIVHSLVTTLHGDHEIARTKNLQAACTLYSHTDIIIIT